MGQSLSTVQAIHLVAVVVRGMHFPRGARCVAHTPWCASACATASRLHGCLFGAYSRVVSREAEEPAQACLLAPREALFCRSSHRASSDDRSVVALVPFQEARVVRAVRLDARRRQHSQQQRVVARHGRSEGACMDSEIRARTLCIINQTVLCSMSSARLCLAGPSLSW